MKILGKGAGCAELNF